MPSITSNSLYSDRRPSHDRGVRVLAPFFGLVLTFSACTGTIGAGPSDGRGQDASVDNGGSDVLPGDISAQDVSGELADGVPSDAGPDDLGGSSDTPTTDDGVPSSETLQGVYERLRPDCVGCHDGVWDKGFFNSFDAFTNLLVLAMNPDGTPRFVVPGDPDGSELVALLEGTGAGNFASMPTDTAFAVSAAAGETEITMAEIRDWILGMSAEQPPVVDTAPTDVQLVRRLRTDQLVAALYGVLGLADEDFWNMTINYGFYEVVGGGFNDNLPMRDPARTPDHSVNSKLRATASERWFALGGPDYLSGRARSQDITPAFVQTITQVSQAWCRLAINKADNDAVLNLVDLSHTSGSDADLISDNIGYLHMRIIGEPATPSEVQALKTNVFEVYESLSDTRAAWTALCATLIRDPRFLTY